ncbi:hypothetical protein HBZS_115620 [Helicobacter bizzozeronii CCUG 35545]|nr:hypothetical protein HBZS_115620 [Helicobacter bizzozeronii CCUG 35545]
MESRREALKKLGTLGVGALAGQSLLATMPERQFPNTDRASNGVVVGKSNKKRNSLSQNPRLGDFL